MSNIFKEIYHLFDIVKQGIVHEEKRVPIRSFGLGECGLHFVGTDDVMQFEKVVDRIFKGNIQIRNDYTRETIEIRLVELLREKIRNKTKFNRTELREFVDSFKKETSYNYTIMRPIVGISIKASKDPPKMGPFTIYNLSEHREIIASKDQRWCIDDWFTSKLGYLIQYETDAKEPEKALEIADDKFEQFILYLWFLIGLPNKRYEIGIFSYEGYGTREAYVFDENEIKIRGKQGYGPLWELEIDSPYFLNQTYGFDFLWQLFDKNDPSELENRIIQSVRWIGQSIMDKSIQSAFVKAAISIEVLIGPNTESNCPSKADYIAERLKLIVAHDDKNGPDISKKFKGLYQTRSDIVHAGREDIELSDYFDLLWIARQIVIQVIGNPSIRTRSSIESVITQLKGLNGSGVSDE